MMRLRTCVSTLAALAAFGIVAAARGGEPSPAEARAMAAIERGGGYATPGAGIIPPGMVVTMGTKTTDDDLKVLHHLKGLSVLTLDGTTVSDAGFAQLEGLNGVKVLGLKQTQITDAGLVHLKELKKLRALDLTGTAISDAGIDQLVQLKGLRELIVDETKITPEGRKRLRRSLWWCRIR